MTLIESSSADPYLELVAMVPQHAPREVFPYLTQVRRASMWTTFHIPPARDSNGHIRRAPGSTYEFWTVDLKEPRIRDAITTGRRAEVIPWRVYELLQMGATVSEFVRLPDDVLAYCRGRSASDTGHMQDAVAAYTEALALSPNQVRYAEYLYPARRDIDDADAWREEFAYYAADADHLVAHSLEPWLKFFVKRVDEVSAQAIVESTRALMKNLLAGSTSGISRRYSASPQIFYQLSAMRMERIIERQLTCLHKKLLRASNLNRTRSRGR